MSNDTSSIFNSAKTLQEYKNTPLFCGPEPGLIDSIYRKHPKLFSLYKELKSLDWSEDEFKFGRCLIDFKNADQDISDMMIETIGWQWEADSVAAKSFLVILAPFISSTEYWIPLVRIADNENIHGLTYSEIVKLSFDDTDTVMEKILSFKNSQLRMQVLETTLAEALKLSRQYAAGLIPLTRELYRDVVLKTVICALFLERIQFIASFAVTFTICGTGLFQPIGKAVQKICQDELEIHSEFDKAVISAELKTEWGALSFEELGPWVKQIHDEILATEFSFIDSLHRNGRALPGATAEMFKNFVLYNMKDVAKFLKIDSGIKYPKSNPMPHIELWTDINKTQAAPQEQDANQYKVGILDDDIGDMIIDIDSL